MEYQNGGTAKVLNLPKELKIKTMEENKMVKVKNITGEDSRFPLKKDLAFKDDKGVRHDIKAGEEVECPYKRSMDHRLVIQPTKKKGVKKDGIDRK